MCVAESTRRGGIEVSYRSITLHTLSQDVSPSTVLSCRPAISLLPPFRKNASPLMRTRRMPSLDAAARTPKRYQYAGFSSRNHKASKCHQQPPPSHPSQPSCGATLTRSRRHFSIVGEARGRGMNEALAITKKEQAA
jgi:hypothetical protein